VTPLLRRSGELLPDPTSARAAGRVGLPPALAVSHQKGFAKLRQENRCRMCQRPASVRPLTRHHVVPRSWFKERPKLACLQHADANIVPLCAPCHSDVERPGDHARIELRRLLRPGELAFALRTAGRRWLDRRYPANSRQLESVGVRLEPAAAIVQHRRRVSEDRARLVHTRHCTTGMCVASCPVWVARGPLAAIRP
jgi:hypothetical protein